MLRRAFLVSGLATLVTAPSWSQINWGGLSDGQAQSGILTALSLASRLATERLGQHDGFYGDPAVRIPLPRSIARVQGNLRAIGMSGPVDDLEVRMNRAAESAMPEARRIFVDTIQSITVYDAVSIVRGGDTAATDYLRGRSEGQLSELIRPLMADTLTASGAYRLVDSIEPHIGGRGGFLGRVLGGRDMSGNLRDTLTDHATGRALDGVFHYVALEEQAIRRDPVRRTSRILRRVFG